MSHPIFKKSTTFEKNVLMDFIVNICTGILIPLCQECVLRLVLITKSAWEPLKLNNEHVGCYCLVHNQRFREFGWVETV